MTLEALAVATHDVADTIFDFSRPAAEPLVVAENIAALAASRAEPEAGWAARNPERAMLFLYLSPREGVVADELLAL